MITDPPGAGLHWSALPPLPEPRYDKQRQESCAGCSLVIGIITACLAATHGSVALGDMPASFQPYFLAAIWTEALIAFVCLLGLMYSDPGVIQRCEDRCDFKLIFGWFSIDF